MNQLLLNTDAPFEQQTYFVEIILPVPIPRSFTYRVPRTLEGEVQIGKRVIVQFGRKKVLTGIIGVIHHKPPEAYQAKYILEVLDEMPSVNQIQIKLFQWIADYYMCTLGEVLNAALPAGLKLSSQSSIQLHPEFSKEDSEFTFSDKEYTLINVLKNQKSMNYDEATALLEQKSIYSLLQSLIDKEAILIFEEVKDKYQPKRIKKVRLISELIEEESKLEAVFETLEKKPKQLNILVKYLQEVNIYHQPEKNMDGLDKKILSTSPFSPSSLNTLVKNGVFEKFEEIVSRFAYQNDFLTDSEIKLSEDQTRAKDEILATFEQKNTVLLHGITGSGKTEIYIDLIKNVLDNGGQVLYLLPEIALTTQIVKRLMKIFGSQMGVFHSKYSDNERVEVWKGVISGKFPLVVGVRSSVFLPFDNLGLVIVDEEHESSYKQYSPAPRFHARDLVLMLAHLHHAKTLLGSATPSIESYYLAQKKQYGLVELHIRYGESVLPEFEVVNLARERKRKTLKEDFSSQLLGTLKATLSEGKQAIIFQNRRGYSPYISCQECSWIPKCSQCDVSLTYHMYRNELRCHYCGYSEKNHASCPACGSTNLKTVGFGTEKLEEDLKNLMPDARIQRMDLDTTRSKYSYQNIIDDFEKGNTDILVGTQILSKGLDFDNVNVVGVVDVDRMIHFPDFRSNERTFQLVTQVSGRAGRRSKQGKVILQTNDPGQAIINKIISYDYKGFYHDELAEREQFLYPPFCRLIKITIKNRDKVICEKASSFLNNLLIGKLGKKRVLGPAEPAISRIRNQYLMEILIKIERGKVNLEEAKSRIAGVVAETKLEKSFKGSRIIIDVDSY